MNNVERIFYDIVKEARTGEVKYQEIVYNNVYNLVFRMKFNVVLNNNVDTDLFNFFISDYESFIKKLKEYVYGVIKLYDMDVNEYQIKKILILLWSNITSSEMLNIDEYVDKYISFINNSFLLNINGSRLVDELGFLNYSFDIQSLKQETPFCFNCYFSNNDVVYYLPRISYGIMDGKCYIYALQNKVKNEKNLEQVMYGEKIKKKLNTLNSGVKKYRNVTPSALVSLMLFVSILKQFNINEIEVVCNLPIRRQNRKLVNNFKLQLESANKDMYEVEKRRIIMNEEDIRIFNNTTVKFKNSFKRLVGYFNIIMKLPEDELNENLFLDVISLDTNNDLVKQIINGNEGFNYGKSL